MERAKPDYFITAQAAADELAVTKNTVLRWLRLGHLTGKLNRITGQYIISAQSLRELKDNLYVEAK